MRRFKRRPKKGDPCARCGARHGAVGVREPGGEFTPLADGPDECGMEVEVASAVDERNVITARLSEASPGRMLCDYCRALERPRRNLVAARDRERREAQGQKGLEI